MRILGFHIAKSQLRYAVMEGTVDNPALVASKKVPTVDPSDVPALMDWYESQFSLIIDEFNPDRISYRLTLEPKKEQLFTSEFPFGILNLLAFSNSIPIISYTSRSFVPSKLGLQRGADLYSHCDSVLGAHPPYWDKLQKHSVLVAWFELPK